MQEVLAEEPQMSRWCMGLPFTRIRPATPDELTRCSTELKRQELRLKRQGWLFGLSVIATVLVSFDYVIQERNIPGNDASILFFSAIAIAMAVSGMAGSAGEVLFGRRFSRILFAVAIGGGILAFLFDAAWSDSVGACAGLLIGIGGNAMLIRQIRERRQMKPFVRALRSDVLETVAWRFEREFPTGDEQHPRSRYSVDVFPRSNVALAIDDTPSRSLTVLKVAEVRSSGTGSIDAPLSSFQPAVKQESLDFRQRHFTDEERTEIQVLLRRDLKALAVRCLMLLWGSLVLTVGADARFNHHPIELNIRSVLLGVVLCSALAMKHVSSWLRIRSDWRGGVLVVVRHLDPKFEGMTVEQLPRSGMLWSQYGAPTPWRTRRTALIR